MNTFEFVNVDLLVVGVEDGRNQRRVAEAERDRLRPRQLLPTLRVSSEKSLRVHKTLQFR